MATGQKEETMVTVLIALLAAIIIFLIIEAILSINTKLFAPLIIIIVLLMLIAAALFYHARLVRKLGHRKPSGLAVRHREDRDSVAELERKLFGDITETMRKLEKR